MQQSGSIQNQPLQSHSKRTWLDATDGTEFEDKQKGVLIMENEKIKEVDQFNPSVVEGEVESLKRQLAETTKLLKAEENLNSENKERYRQLYENVESKYLKKCSELESYMRKERDAAMYLRYYEIILAFGFVFSVFACSINPFAIKDAILTTSYSLLYFTFVVGVHLMWSYYGKD